MSRFTIKISLLTSLLFIANSLYAESHHKVSYSFKTNQVTENIHLLQGRGGNVAVLSGDQGLLMVDSDYQDMSSALKRALKPLGGNNKLVYIINTHWHGDHTGGNKSLYSPTTIIAHDNVRTRLLSRQEVKLFNKVSEPYPEYAVPSLTYQKRLHLHINDEDIEVLHLSNGHTDGDSIVFFKHANVVHMGDHYFSGFFPFVDIDSGGNVLNMANNIRLVLQRINDDTKIIPGHGPLSSKADLKAFHDMLTGTSAEVKAMRSKGMSLTQIQDKGLSSRWAPWTKGFLNTKTWITILYNSLSQ